MAEPEQDGLLAVQEPPDGKKGPRRSAKDGGPEFFPTPAYVVQQIVRRLDLPGGYWLEPSAGDGAIIRAVNAIRQDVRWSAVELLRHSQQPLMDTGAAVSFCDFLGWTPPEPGTRFTGKFAVACMNPPFSLAQRFVERCLDLADWVVCLERLNWLEGPREQFLAGHMPDVYVLSSRPSFTGGGTDGCAYGWMVWGPACHNRKRGTVEVLPSQPGQTAMFAGTQPAER